MEKCEELDYVLERCKPMQLQIFAWVTTYPLIPWSKLRNGGVAYEDSFMEILILLCSRWAWDWMLSSFFIQAEAWASGWNNTHSQGEMAKLLRKILPLLSPGRNEGQRIFHPLLRHSCRHSRSNRTLINYRMDRIQNEISKLRHEQHLSERLQAAQLRQIKREHDGLHKWITITPRLKLLCRIDEQGNLLPKELDRIKKVKQTLGIK